MYHKAYGILETLAPVHVGASAGEETGNLNLIFRDQFTQTGIIPGSSIRGRFRADMREINPNKVGHWYGNDAETGDTSEGIVKFEYASILWIPVFCPNQPTVYVSCPRLLRRYQRITGQKHSGFKPYHHSGKKEKDMNKLFFNLGYLPLLDRDPELKDFFPEELVGDQEYLLVIVDDTEIAMIHDMALYRQSRVALDPNQKKAADKAFFNVEALPEGTLLSFPIALRKKTATGDPVEWKTYLADSAMKEKRELYFGGLESVGFGRTQMIFKQQSV
ncbi:RAMP superfamily CRISPR-associated protein [Leptothoe spongobia]|uniref:Type III-B CRISPR module RAMP protein Cmr4 n=1 Tax=Leptothoe spongobia TAU-MAC 1115 TaxID=1967444 RepID=A0A947DLB1_9CYAN|nr:RAMP superfamily CRISPR-associated protein [Leptothoe spongobia]MBT9317691.1 type III-B CRISPR module RAMP protein Cmr4 [Leptothoe spongobia TAU-MAC 1115]